MQLATGNKGPLVPTNTNDHEDANGAVFLEQDRKGQLVPMERCDCNEITYATR